MINIRSGTPLGAVGWYSPWRQYCFFPIYDTVFNATCLADIQDFIGQAKKHREKQA